MIVDWSLFGTVSPGFCLDTEIATVSARIMQHMTGDRCIAVVVSTEKAVILRIDGEGSEAIA